MLFHSQNTKFFSFLVLVLVPIASSQKLFVDQVGKYDWRIQGLGRFTQALEAWHYHSQKHLPILLVATDLGVLAAIHTTNGDIIWRNAPINLNSTIHHLSTPSVGQFKSLHAAHSQTPSMATFTPKVAAVVTEHHPYLTADTMIDTHHMSFLRVYAMADEGKLLWQRSLSSAISTSGPYDHSEYQILWSSSLDYIVLYTKSKSTLAVYDAKKGEHIISEHINPSENVFLFPALTVPESNADQQPLCIKASRKHDELVLENVLYEKDKQTPSFLLIQQWKLSGLSCSQFSIMLIILHGFLLCHDHVSLKFTLFNVKQLTVSEHHINEPVYKVEVHDQYVLLISENSFTLLSAKDQEVSVRTNRGILDSNCRIFKKDSLKTVKIRDNQVQLFSMENQLLDFISSNETLLPSNSCSSFHFEGTTNSLLSWDNGQMTMISYELKKVLWVREEALAYPTDSSFFDVQSFSNKNFVKKDLGILLKSLKSSPFYRDGFRDFRQQIQSHILSPGKKDDKVLVITTKTGIIYGLSITARGKIVWKSLLQTFAEGEPLYYCSHQLYHVSATKIGVLRTCDDIYYYDIIDSSSGKVLESSQFEGSRILQSAMISDEKNQDKILVILDHEYKFHSFPSSPVAIKEAELLYWVLMEKNGLVGLHGVPGSDTVRILWNILFPETHEGSIIAMPQNDISKVNPAKVTGSRQVMVKYLHNGLSAVITESILESSVQAMLVDVISGKIIDSYFHENVVGPISAVRCDHWVIYSFWNAHVQEQELHVIEMYRNHSESWVKDAILTSLKENFRGGKTSSTVKKISARELGAPIIIREQFLLSSRVVSMSVTKTALGITMKAILLVLENGQVISIPKRILDPRRPKSDKASPEEAAELLMPYQPVIMATPNNVLLQYVTLDKIIPMIKKVSTSSIRHQESSLHFAVTGLDIMYNELSPAGKFDTLPDDLNVMTVMLTIVVLMIGIVYSRAISKRAELHLKWL